MDGYFGSFLVGALRIGQNWRKTKFRRFPQFFY